MAYARKTKKNMVFSKQKGAKSSSLHPHLLILLHFSRKHRNFHTKADYFRSTFDLKTSARCDAMKGKEEQLQKADQTTFLRARTRTQQVSIFTFTLHHTE